LIGILRYLVIQRSSKEFISELHPNPHIGWEEERRSGSGNAKVPASLPQVLREFEIGNDNQRRSRYHA
jgi:hypothetical protein